jgi:GGDEF domain-containing protein
MRDNEILAQLGGDEFLVLLDLLQAPENIASYITTLIAQPFEFKSYTLYSNASMVITQSRMIYKYVSEILHNVDTAMYEEKV